jgi:predicted ATPase/class 3 adenylate cyclase
MHRLVPQFILDNYQAGNYHGRFQAVGLLVDVTGFSTMTDALARQGMHGSEVLANGMRQVFDPMIQSVIEHGGYVVGFAGDAITALFPVAEPVAKAYSKAIAAALDIQEHRKNNADFVTPYGRFNISVKIGLGAGEARWRIVVAADGKRATYYFHGAAIDQAVSSLNLSSSGDIILSPDLYRASAGAVSGTRKGKGFLLTGYAGELPARTEIELPLPDPEHLRLFCSAEVSSHDLTGEFRPAVNLFIGIQPDADREMHLESFIQQVFSLQDVYGGLFSRVDIGDKGTNLLMFWGAPLAQENDVERALNFFLELLKESKAPLKAGITYRLAYAGYMGGSLQEEYTCYGWGVNLSARLMMAAGPGEMWVDEEIARRAGGRFNFQQMGQQKFKGFAREQNVFRLLERKEDDRAIFSGEFVGREAELETLRSFIGPIWSGEFAGMLTVFGEPGIGKSRLVDAFKASGLFVRNKFYWAVCQTDQIVRQSLNPFRYWLKRYFNITESMDEAESKQAFDEKLEAVIASIPDEDLSQNLDRTRSFLGELVDLHWPDSLYEKLDAQGRYDNTFIALITLLRGESLRQPVLILIEDTHWLDNDTKAFLLYLERTLLAETGKSYPVAIIATSRREGTPLTLEQAQNTTLDLTELTRADLSKLAENLLDGEAAPALLEILEGRAEGNPFFIEQIVRYLQETDRLEPSEKGWQIAGEQTLEALPTDISAILVSRLDRLNREVRDVVQTAAVLGREFELRLLSKMLHDDRALPEKVHHAVEAEILSALTEIRYIFRHALLRDAAYDMQLRARRQELHRIAVEAFEFIYRDQLSPHYSEIAYHADRAGLRDKAKRFYILAGEDTARAYKNSLGIESYTRALALSSIEDIQERIDLLLARVALYRIVGDRAGQEQDLATLELLADKQQNDRNRAIVALQQADFAFDLGEFQEAQRLAESTIEIAESAHAIDVVAHAYRTLPLALARQGQIKRAIQAAQIGLQLTQQVADRESEGQTLNQLGLIMLDQGETEQASDYFEKSLLIAQETDNRRLEAQVLNNMGKISGEIENDYVTARRFFEKTLEIVREIGHRIGEGYALGNLGWAASMGGDFEQARVYYLERLTIARESGNRSQEAYGMINLSAMMITQETYSDALEYAEQALNLASKLGDRSAEAWALTFLGFANLGLGNLRDAKDLFQTAHDIRHSMGQKTLAMEPLAGLAQIELDKDNLVTALMYVEKILLHLAEGGSLEGTEEPLRVYLSVYLTLIANRDPRAAQILEAAYALLQAQVDRIQDQTGKKMYVQNVPWRRQIEEIWQQKQASKKRNA